MPGNSSDSVRRFGEAEHEDENKRECVKLGGHPHGKGTVKFLNSTANFEAIVEINGASV